MGKLTDIQIRSWIKAGERFESRCDGDGLYMRYREVDAVPLWRFRYVNVTGFSKRRNDADRAINRAI